MAAGRGEGRGGGEAAPDAILQWVAFEGRKFVILALALHCVSVSLFLICSVHRGWVLPVGGAARRTFAPGGKNPRAATDFQKTSVLVSQH